uniref:Transcription factor TFIIIC triple barrel domain-containing protein n=1 Tax=Tetradesmus obliquus TaxID=3088 RepID=A0A383VW62_TETOB
MSETQDVTLTEGDEEVQYVFVPLPKDADAASFGAGTVVQFEGLGTERPLLRSQQGDSVLVGAYQDTLGSLLLVKEQPGAAFNSKNTYSVIGHTEKQLTMARSD